LALDAALAFSTETGLARGTCGICDFRGCVGWSDADVALGTSDTNGLRRVHCSDMDASMASIFWTVAARLLVRRSALLKPELAWKADETANVDDALNPLVANRRLASICRRCVNSRRRTLSSRRLDSMRARSFFWSRSLCPNGTESYKSARRDAGLRMMLASLASNAKELDLVATP